MEVTSSETGKPVSLYNPRTDVWSDHFEWDAYAIVGTTEVGRATIEAFDLNHERRQKIRQSEQMFGKFPPED